MLNYHAFEDIFSASTSCSLHPELHFLDNTTVDVGLSMDIYDWSEQKLQIRLGYCRNLYDDDTIESLGRDLQKWIGIFATSDWKSAHIDHTWRTNGFYKRESLCQ
jgi:hypothetical protein